MGSSLPLATTRITSVALAQLDSDRLVRARIDSPKAGFETDTPSIEITGEVVGRRAPAVAIAIVHQGRPCHETSIVQPPADGAALCGVDAVVEHGRFATRIQAAGIGPLQVDVQVVLRDQSRVPLATIHLVHEWSHTQPPACAFVSIVITCFNQAQFLADAIESALAQTYPNFEVIVVDDGSDDNTTATAERYPGVRYVRQGNQGLAAARNTGIAKSCGDYLVFLDADDCLTPNALETGLREFARHPECAFVAGRHRMIGFDGGTLWEHGVGPEDDDLYCALLRRNFIAMHAAVMYQRLVFETIGGFDWRPYSTEDYDMYLRIARRHATWWHTVIVAEYRRHGANMTRDAIVVLKSALLSLRSQRDGGLKNEKAAQAYRAGTRFFRNYYGREVVKSVGSDLTGHRWRSAAKGALTLLRYYPRGLWLLGRMWNQGWNGGHDQRVAGVAQGKSVETGVIDMGGLRRLTPISNLCGFDRGLPVDRHYVEVFLAAHAADIRGRVLEIGDANYTRKFGTSRVSAIDVLNVESDDPNTTIVADLSHAEHIPSGTFDCIIATQTLQYIDSPEAAVGTFKRILKPGGVLLLTAPGTISRISPDAWRARWNWGFTAPSLQRMFQRVWGDGFEQVQTYGNVLVSMAILHGLAAHELTRAELDEIDPAYPVLLTARAIKQPTTQGRSAATITRSSCRPLILLYHRIGHSEPDPWGLSVTPDHFAEHLEVIARQAHAVRLGDLVDGRSVEPSSVAMTFDDGYADNFLDARPLLERHGVPATVFVATGYVGAREFWWDALARYVFDPPVLPGTPSMTIGVQTYQWRLGAGAVSNTKGGPAWRAWHDDPTSRHYLYRSLFELLRVLPVEERKQGLDEVGRWSGAIGSGAGDSRPLAQEELLLLARCDLFEFGCHTRTHPVLSSLDLASQREEIAGSKRDLKLIIGAEPKSFAYPYGQRSTYADTTVELVRDAGFKIACTNFSGYAGPGADPLQLPRLHVDDWDGDEFANRLLNAFSGDW